MQNSQDVPLFPRVQSLETVQLQKHLHLERSVIIESRKIVKNNFRLGIGD
uniref:Uncharacterized protein n=1 Tax=Arundo donax TaxID=35708 RepID=A0A0A8ZQP0_ARUDO